jgi:hypothetical protein
MKWQKKLTKKELRHVKEWCGGTLAGLKSTREHQKLMAEQGKALPCFECQSIAQKLGLEE